MLSMRVQSGHGGATGTLTRDRTEAPALVLAVIVRGGAPQVPVLTPNTRAAVEPLAIIQEGEVTGASLRITLDGVDVWRQEKKMHSSLPSFC